MLNSKQKRILIVDDNPNIHEDFKKILLAKSRNELDNMQEILFGKKDNIELYSASHKCLNP